MQRENYLSALKPLGYALFLTRKIRVDAPKTAGLPFRPKTSENRVNERPRQYPTAAAFRVALEWIKLLVALSAC
jgi:hypothetical protein